MPRAGPARTWKLITAGAAAGILAAAGLFLGEVGAASLAQAPLPPRAWLVLSLYYFPALSLAGALLALVWPRGAAVPGRVQGLLVAATAFAWAVTVASQDHLRGRGVSLRLAAAAAAAAAIGVGAWAVERRLARAYLAHARTGRLLLVVLPVVFVVTLDQSSDALRDAPAAIALVVLPLLATASAVAAAFVLAWAVHRRPRPSLAALVVLTVLASVTLGAQARRGGPVIEQPQPPWPPASGTPARPNVVLIVLDTVRASSLSSYGYERLTTPQLDAFAKGAIRFTHAMTVSPWSVPAHASLFTGLLPTQHGAGRGVRGERGALQPASLDGRFVTLAEALAQGGYATAAISANPLVAPSMNLTQGFRHVDVRRSNRSLPPRPRPLLLRVAGFFPRWAVADRVQSWFPSDFRSAAEIADAAIAWLERPLPSDQPYFLFLNFMDAHTPFVARPGFQDRWPGRSRRLASYGLAAAGEVMGGQRAITAEEEAHLRALYDAGLSYLDHEVGRLLAVLEARPDADRTLLIVTADHGEGLGERGRIGHDCVLLQRVLHVPLVVRYPRAPGPWSGIVQPAVEDRPIQIVDLRPLVLAAAGMETAPPPPPRPAGGMVADVDCFCAADHPRFHGPAGASVVVDGLEYIEEQGRPPLLFDLASDPAETHDLATARPQDAARLLAALADWRGRVAEAVPPPPDAAGAREGEDALRALGYIR